MDALLSRDCCCELAVRTGAASFPIRIKPLTVLVHSDSNSDYGRLRMAMGVKGQQSEVKPFKIAGDYGSGYFGVKVFHISRALLNPGQASTGRRLYGPWI